MACVAPDLSLLAVSEGDCLVGVYSRYGSPIVKVSTTSPSTCCCFVTSNWLLAGTVSGSVECFSLSSGELISSLDLSSVGPVMQVSCSRQTVFALCSNSSSILSLEVSETGLISQGESLKADSSPIVAFSEEGDFLATLSRKKLRVWNLSTKSLISTVSNEGSYTSVSVGSEGQVVVGSETNISRLQSDAFVSLLVNDSSAFSISTDDGIVSVDKSNKTVKLVTPTTSTFIRDLPETAQVLKLLSSHILLRSLSGIPALIPLRPTTVVEDSETLLIIAKNRKDKELKLRGLQKRQTEEVIERAAEFLIGGRTGGISMFFAENAAKEISQSKISAETVKTVRNSLKEWSGRNDIGSKLIVLRKLVGKLAMVLSRQNTEEIELKRSANKKDVLHTEDTMSTDEHSGTEFSEFSEDDDEEGDDDEEDEDDDDEEE